MYGIIIFVSCIVDNAGHADDDVRDGAVRAFHRLTLTCKNDAILSEISAKIVTSLTSKSSSGLAADVSARIGLVSLLGVTSSPSPSPDAMTILLEICEDNNRWYYDPAVKSRAVLSLISMFCRHHSLYEYALDRVCMAMAMCLEDYHVDNRGDVGSWVRSAALLQLKHLVSATISFAESENWVHKFCLYALQLTVEKIDKMRSIAGYALEGLSSLDNIPDAYTLKEVAVRGIDLWKNRDVSSDTQGLPMTMVHELQREFDERLRDVDDAHAPNDESWGDEDDEVQACVMDAAETNTNIEPAPVDDDNLHFNEYEYVFNVMRTEPPSPNVYWHAPSVAYRAIVPLLNDVCSRIFYFVDVLEYSFL